MTDDHWIVTLYHRYVELYGDPDHDPSHSAMNASHAATVPRGEETTGISFMPPPPLPPS
jgi:hypothetical protein